jgi:hypothetical protein
MPSYFTGVFPARVPNERSNLSHWRKPLGDKLEFLLAESLRVAHESGGLRTKLRHRRCDRATEEHHLLHRRQALAHGNQGLNPLARKPGLRLRRERYLSNAERSGQGSYQGSLVAEAGPCGTGKDAGTTSAVGACTVGAGAAGGAEDTAEIWEVIVTAGLFLIRFFGAGVTGSTGFG